MADIGPVEYMVVVFPGNKFTGNLAPALARLVEKGIVRIIDLAFVSKDASGNVVAMEVEDLDSAVGKAFQTLQGELGELINNDDLIDIGEGLNNNTSAAVLVWEDVWATEFASALREAGGELLTIQRIPYEVVKAALDYTTAKS